MKTKQGFAGIAALIAVVVAIIIGGAYAYRSLNNVGPDSIVSMPAGETPANWQTFKSNTYDYEIKHPSVYATSSIFVRAGVQDIDQIEYKDKDYRLTLSIFARNNDSALRDCLKGLGGKDITATKEVNGNKFYAYKENEEGVGGRMALVLGAMRSEYRIIHNNYCYYVDYVIVPEDINSPVTEQTRVKFGTLDQIFSTFKFTK